MINMVMGKIVNKITKVQLGTSDLYNIKNAIWDENSPWVQLEVPGGKMLWQDIRSRVVTGSFTTLDLDTLNSTITSLLGTKFSEDGEGLKFFMVTVDGTEIVASFTDVRIVNFVPDTTLTEKVKEVGWKVVFYADSVEVT